MSGVPSENESESSMVLSENSTDDMGSMELSASEWNSSSLQNIDKVYPADNNSNNDIISNVTNPTVETAHKKKRGRGRPPKKERLNASAAVTPPLKKKKRGPGRPKGARSELVLETDAYTPSSTKRKRGQDLYINQDMDWMPEPKRGRGRPGQKPKKKKKEEPSSSKKSSGGALDSAAGVAAAVPVVVTPVMIETAQKTHLYCHMCHVIFRNVRERLDHIQSRAHASVLVESAFQNNISQTLTNTLRSGFTLTYHSHNNHHHNTTTATAPMDIFTPEFIKYNKDKSAEMETLTKDIENLKQTSNIDPAYQQYSIEKSKMRLNAQRKTYFEVKTKIDNIQAGLLKSLKCIPECMVDVVDLESIDLEFLEKLAHKIETKQLDIQAVSLFKKKMANSRSLEAFIDSN